jgi:hypothetical protein
MLFLIPPIPISQITNNIGSMVIPLTMLIFDIILNRTLDQKEGTIDLHMTCMGIELGYVACQQR